MQELGRGKRSGASDAKNGGAQCILVESKARTEEPAVVCGGDSCVSTHLVLGGITDEALSVGEGDI